MAHSKPTCETDLMQGIDGRLVRIGGRLPRTQHRAIQYCATAGILAGGLVACGLTVARLKLGL